MVANNNWYGLALEEIYRRLGTNSGGLTTATAEKIYKIHGPNVLPEAKADSLAVIFLRQFQSPLIYILLAAGAIVFWLGEYIDGAVIAAVLLVNAVVGAVQEGKAQNTLLALKKFVETFALVLRDGKEIILGDDKIVPGDIIILTEGDKTPADCRLITVDNLAVNEAALTGESQSVVKSAGILRRKKAPIAERRNMVFKGTSIAAGRATGVAVATGSRTEIGKISRVIAGIHTEMPFRASLRELSRLVILAVAAIVALLFLLEFVLGNGGWHKIFLTGVAMAVSAIPEGLPVVATLILAFGVTRMAKSNVLVKRLQAVEALGQTKVVAIDKTGTITRNEMVVKKIFTDGKIFDVSGTGYRQTGRVSLSGETASVKNFPELELAGRVASFSSSAHIFGEKILGDPTEAAILTLGGKLGFTENTLVQYPKIGEIPFSYKKKYHVAFRRLNGKIFTAVTGAPEAVLSLSNKIWRNGKAIKITGQERQALDNVLNQLSDEALRVIAFAFAISKNHSGKKIPPLVFGGFYAMEDAVREGTPAAVNKVRRAGMRPVMITGDLRTTAVAVARQVGIFREGDKVLTGTELESLSDKKLDAAINEVTVFARVTPEDKMRIVEAYRRRGEVVAMTGDGVNDAPSLVAADLGVAMGKIGTSVAQEASDIILLDDNFSIITTAVEEGRHIYQTIKKTVLYLFSTNLGEVLVIFGSILLGWPLPLLPAQIIWLNLITDGFLDVTFAWEPKGKDLLKSGFTRPGKYIIDRLMMKRGALMSATMMIAGLIVFGMYLNGGGPKALTMTLTTLAMMQWLNAINIRSETRSVFSVNPLSNKAMLAAIGLELGLQIAAVHWGPLQTLLRTVPLSLSDWLWAFGLASSIIVVEELRKIIYRYDQLGV